MSKLYHLLELIISKVNNATTGLENCQPKGDYAEASDIPTKLSQLVNDVGYITEIPEVSNTYYPEIAGFIRENGTISTSTNYKRTNYLLLDGVSEVEYTTFVVGNSEMATWALFDAQQKWVCSSEDRSGTDYYTTRPDGSLVIYGLLHKTVSVTELLETHPSAKYIVMSTNNTASYESLKNQNGEDVGWGSTEQYITLR